MFSGTWDLVGALQQPWLSGRPHLLLGHYGPDLVGTIRYGNDVGIETGTCKCGLLEGTDVDLNAASFSLVSHDCDGELLLWQLDYDENANGEPVLTGDVGPPDYAAEDRVHVDFRLVDRFVASERRACPEDGDP